VLEHPAREMTGDRFNHVIRFAGLQQSGYHCMPQVVKAKVEGAALAVMPPPKGVWQWQQSVGPEEWQSFGTRMAVAVQPTVQND
jgi:hypothetical protein